MDSEIESEFILSICWKAGSLSAVFYDLVLMEISVLQEMSDFKPDYPLITHLFHKNQPSNLILAGPKNFLEDISEVLNLSSTDFKKKYTTIYGDGGSKTCFVTFHTHNKRNIEIFRKKIYELQLPGLPAEASALDKHIFIDTVLPMENPLIVYALGNLLSFLEENSSKYTSIFSSFGRSLMIANVDVNFVESQVMIDNSTLNALNVFSSIHHPASFKNQIRKDGLSIFNLLNQCCSRIGSQQLKLILKHPIRDLSELNVRLSTIEWCTKQENLENVIKLKTYLKNLLNINNIFHQIITNYGKTNDWKSLKKTVYFAFLICEMCTQFDQESIQSTFLFDLAKFVKNELTIKGILYALDKIVDLEEIDNRKRFCVKPGIDKDLDKKNENLKNMRAQEVADLEDGLKRICDMEEAFHLLHFSEIGFVFGTDLKMEDLNLEGLENDQIELVLQTVDAIYFRTFFCKELNLQYEMLLTDIISHEMRIFYRLIKYIQENIADLIQINKICAKLDCMIAMAGVSISRGFTKPIFTTEKRIQIINGRHPLVEQIRKFSPNSTDIRDEQQNFINILNSPNASGKSIYMKQIALICYLAHVGCFVPADDCVVTLLDSIYSRIYCQESIYQGQSSFMIDLAQMSKVVMNSSSNSLVLVDEIGKGTNYKDGMALLAATIENFIDRKHACPITFIATHYFEVYSILKSKEMTSLLTIASERDQNGVCRSTYQVMHGPMTQRNFTEFPESNKIINNIFRDSTKSEELENFNQAYSSALRVFIIILMKMYLKKHNITFKLLHDLFTKVDLHNFLK